ncbi:MAG: lysine 2,3-aminomutase [Candidatus Promineifilaceae bacterium]|nr:lysine 2,3-aminomutase [Candidatus Promineifilaceae bacterium]
MHTRALYWNDVPDEKWMDWRWQMSNRLNSLEELGKVIKLTEGEKKALGASGLFRVDITPYFASLIDPDNRECPVRKQVIPTAQEMVPFHSMMADSLAEDKHSPVPGLVHRYPDRVLMLVTTQCASYCRYCTRSRIVGDPTQTFSRAEFDAQIDYIERTPQIRDVLLSGGDPMVLAPKLLDMILARLRAIPHLEIIRIGSRVPVFLPMRVTEEFCEMISQYHPLWMNIHVNHPKEITPELAAAADRLSRAGVPLGNQSVLLAGVNDSVRIQRQLVHDLVKIRVRPYYLYQCDLVAGSGHFRTTVSKGIEIMEGLRGHTSGYAVPTYVVDAPGGGGKIPVGPNYMLAQSPNRVVLRNFEGFITTYTEPEEYDPREVEALEEQIEPRPEPGQEGIYGLLQGERMYIEPEGFDEIHARGGAEHRLRSGEVAEKWQPMGVGAIDIEVTNRLPVGERGEEGKAVERGGNAAGATAADANTADANAAEANGDAAEEERAKSGV